MQLQETDVVIIGAGPSGSIAANLLRQKGHSVIIIERMQFPRFIIGESLLPQCLITLEKAGCLEAISAAGFQQKVGATFQHRSHYEKIIFDDKFSQGPATAYHVQRAEFDTILTDCAQQKGAKILWQSNVTAVSPKFNNSLVKYQDKDGIEHQIKTRFVLDASGYGRVLPKLLNIDKPSSLEPKASLFSHVQDHIDESLHSRNETLIVTHPVHRDVWYWLICFSNGRSSIGVVGSPEFMQPYQEQGIQGLQQLINEDPDLSQIMANSKFDTQDYQLNAYSGNVSRLCGDGYAVLGNAGEFLDPIFSSGVTVAIQSSDLAVSVLDKMLKGEEYNWQSEFVDELKLGVNVFKCFVNNWYDGGFQDVIYSQSTVTKVKKMIASILAGYAWDKENPFVQQPNKHLNSLISICQQ